MKIFKIGILGLLVLGVLLVVSFGQSQPSPQIFEAKSATLGEVTIEVKPEKLGAAEVENIFAVKFDTHTIGLDFDFEKIISLEDDRGNRYQAVRWEGERGGHHLEGKIVFSQIKKSAQRVALRISSVGGREKNFDWEL